MTYTHGHHESVLRSHRWRTVENSAAYVAPRFVPGARVLDVGCGPGTITVDIADRVAPGRVIGIDASADVIDQARRDASGVDNVDFATGDVYALDLPDSSFDVVHAHQVLQHLPEPDAGRFLLAWAHAAGFSDVEPAASAWCFATPDDRAWWGDLWADRMTSSAIAKQAERDHFATRPELEEMAAAWRRWSAHPDAWFAVLHGEIVCSP